MIFAELHYSVYLLRLGHAMRRRSCERDRMSCHKRWPIYRLSARSNYGACRYYGIEKAEEAAFSSVGFSILGYNTVAGGLTRPFFLSR